MRKIPTLNKDEDSEEFFRHWPRDAKLNGKVEFELMNRGYLATDAKFINPIDVDHDIGHIVRDIADCSKEQFKRTNPLFIFEGIDGADIHSGPVMTKCHDSFVKVDFDRNSTSFMTDTPMLNLTFYKNSDSFLSGNSTCNFSFELNMRYNLLTECHPVQKNSLFLSLEPYYNRTSQAAEINFLFNMGSKIFRVDNMNPDERYIPLKIDRKSENIFLNYVFKKAGLEPAGSLDSKKESARKQSNDTFCFHDKYSGTWFAITSGIIGLGYTQGYDLFALFPSKISHEMLNYACEDLHVAKTQLNDISISSYRDCTGAEDFILKKDNGRVIKPLLHEVEEEDINPKHIEALNRIFSSDYKISRAHFYIGKDHVRDLLEFLPRLQKLTDNHFAAFKY